MEYNRAVPQLLTGFKQACHSMRNGVLCNNIYFGILTKLVTFIEMCLRTTSSKVQIDKYLSDKFPTQNSQKH